MANETSGVESAMKAMRGVLAERAGTDPRAQTAAIAARRHRAHAVRSGRRHAREDQLGLHSGAMSPLVETDTSPGFSAMRLVAVGRGPISDMSVDPHDGLLYVANHVDNSISVLDPDGLNVVSTMSAAGEPFAVAAVGGRAHVSTVATAYDTISVIEAADDATDVRNLPVAHSVRDLAVSPRGQYVYAARNGRHGADLAVVDTTDGRVTKVNLGTRPGAAAEAITLSPDGNRVYVATADNLGGELVAIDTVTCRVVGGLALPWPLRDVVTSPDGATVFVASCDPAIGGVIDAVDARRLDVVDSIDVGGVITELVVSAGGERLYVANGDRISVLCTTTGELVDDITVVAEPSCIAESADGRQLFIADYHGTVTVLGISSTTESLLAKMSADVIDVPMLELEYAGV